jgi:hypothetical protein
MDNGLIFPYPCMSVPDETILLTTQKAGDCLLREPTSAGCVGPGWVVVKRWGDAGRQPYQSVVILGQTGRESDRQIRLAVILRGDA